MKSNDIKALHTKTTAELQQLVVELQQQLAKVRLEKAARKSSSGAVPSRISDDIARVKTVMTEQKLAAKKPTQK
jgi:ribosomal protein L29